MRLLVSFFLLSISISPLWAKVNSNGDTQLWASTLFRANVMEKVDVSIYNEIRFGDAFQVPYFTLSQFFALYRPIQPVELFGGFRMVSRARTATNKHLWFYAYDPVLGFTFFQPVHNWVLSNRFWGQYSYVPLKGVKDRFLYRNRFNVKTPYSLFSDNCNVYFFDEFFLVEGHGLNQNRISIGIDLELNTVARSFMEIMMRQLKVGNQWRNHPVLNINLNFTF